MSSQPEFGREVAHIPCDSRDVTLQQLVQEHDSLMYGHDEESQSTAHQVLRRMTNVTVVNSFTSLDRLWAYLDRLYLSNPDRLRPQWDTYFMVNIGGLICVDY